MLKGMDMLKKISILTKNKALVSSHRFRLVKREIKQLSDSLHNDG